MGTTAPPLAKLDYDELLALRWFGRNRPDEMTEGAWSRLRDLEQQLRAYQEAQWAAHTRQWSKGLTRAKVRELERKLKSDEDLTDEKLQQWSAAVRMSEPHSLGEEDWDAWYERPVSTSLFGPPAACTPPRLVGTLGLRAPRQSARRRLRLAVRGSPGRPDRPDDDPPLRDVARGRSYDWADLQRRRGLRSLKRGGASPLLPREPTS